MLQRMCSYLWIFGMQDKTPQTATLHLRNLSQCLPVLKSVIRDITAMSTAWAQAGGFTEAISGLVTHLLPDAAKRYMLAHSFNPLHPLSPFIRSLVNAPRSPHPPSPVEKDVARQQLELYLGEAAGAPRFVCSV
jgi:hypothetical protein